MYKKNIHIIIFIISVATSISEFVIKKRVIAGEDANIEEFSFLVMIVYQFQLFNGSIVKSKGCSGSLIGERWVLTADHCYGAWIRYPNTSVPFDDESMFIKIIKLIAFPNADIKLLKLEKSAIVKQYAKISVDYRTLNVNRAKVVAFGLTYMPEKEMISAISKKERLLANRSMPLQTEMVVIRPYSKFKVTSLTYGTRGSYICVGPPCDNRRLQPYFGDSGSPLLVEGTTVGVSHHIHFENFAYTAVSLFLNWIQSVVNEI